MEIMGTCMGSLEWGRFFIFILMYIVVTYRPLVSPWTHGHCPLEIPISDKIYPWKINKWRK